MKLVTFISFTFLVIFSQSDLLLLDEFLKDLYWCGRPRCCLEYDAEIWDAYGYNHTNECTTTEDCIVGAAMNGCGILDQYPWFVTDTEQACIEMGESGKNYCSLTCTISPDAPCAHGGLNFTEFAPQYCYFYYDNVTDEIIPDCPCLSSACDFFDYCEESPIQHVMPLPSPSPSPSPLA